ncbi:MAG: DtxR family transcriptional regulator [Candidatus Handelsmanbacteria bacterium RIFCSPLOWO2_12_FULL_64_10]|uniref:Manganese transport regulator n=1 Tax=Handelsmanbacteria sp. (strain RIFCSPLOWO2_12_FULL_64_10) TaxID=1817868 RepID=A0A1F6C407_HANXR|nr:MAG: DtxR family transcriptional regulator [Candidatus Handelsmanbacteria bacterium RIFCSPLOWO2_12_FULL_64_10]
MSQQMMSEERTKLTRVIEDYLKFIYKLQQSGEKVTTSAIAERLNVSAASVTSMVKRLAEMNLLTHAPYHGVGLTPAGARIALEVIRHHRLLELYLTQALGFGWDAVDAEAERLEHVISEEFEAKINEALGNPTLDPHGASIPTKDGEMDQTRYVPLSSASSGQRVVIRQVSDRDPDMLRYMAGIGIGIGMTVEVVDKAPFKGPVTLQVGDGQHALGLELADHIYVTAEC